MCSGRVAVPAHLVAPIVILEQIPIKLNDHLQCITTQIKPTNWKKYSTIRSGGNWQMIVWLYKTSLKIPKGVIRRRKWQTIQWPKGTKGVIRRRKWQTIQWPKDTKGVIRRRKWQTIQWPKYTKGVIGRRKWQTIQWPKDTKGVIRRRKWQTIQWPKYTKGVIRRRKWQTIQWPKETIMHKTLQRKLKVEQQEFLYA